MSDLRAVVVVDYQNVHLTGYGLFPSVRDGPPHEALVHPLHFGNQLIQARNRLQRDGMAHATLTGVRVYRGLPLNEHEPKPYARNLKQKANWTRDKRVEVELRPLKYSYVRDDDGRPVTDDRGRRVLDGPPREKGVDVLCALALVREASRSDVDLVILASHDTDLEPALDEAVRLRSAKVETFCWYDHSQRARCRQLRPSSGRLWNTRLGETDFLNSLDRVDYT